MQRSINPVTLASEAIARCQRLTRFSEDANGLRRTFLSSPTRDCHAEITSWLTAVGAGVSVDDAGNLRGFYPGAHSRAPRLLIGSHLDTVPNAGAYDGILGVVLGVALLESLEGRKLPFGIEVVGFSEEEGVRFGVPFIGSRALVGRLDAELLKVRDLKGISVWTAIENFGLNPTEIPNAAIKNDVLAYLEFHIEQGPVLETLGQPLGVVEAIVGQTRLEIRFIGQANHAGTTPMNHRHDALAGAAEWIVEVERVGQKGAGLVATVGQIEAIPGASNVIASEARVTLDIRHKSDDVRCRATDLLIGRAEEIGERRGLLLRKNRLMSQPAVAMDPFLTDQIERAIRSTNSLPHRMASGAGHDAMILAEKVPAAMVFLRSPGGISHDPAESVNPQDVACALECGMHLLEQLAGSPEFLTRICRA